jgi:ferredoxin--NADP+ reductase
MCGGCRVLVGGKSQFACVDGPEFDALEVDFNVLIQRNRMYRQAEQRSLEEYKKHSLSAETREKDRACLVEGKRS